MLNEIKTKKIDVKEFEKKVENTYEKFKDIEENSEYIELWNTFVEMIEFIQESNFSNEEMTPREALELMKEVGFSPEEMKDIIKSGIQNDQ